MTDLIIKTENAEQLKTSLTALADFSKATRADMTEMRKALDAVVAEGKAEAAKHGSAFGETGAKLVELSTKAAEALGKIGTVETAIKDHQAALDRISIELSKPRVTEDDKLRQKSIEEALALWRIKHWEAVPAGEQASDIGPAYVTEERRKAYEDAKAVQARIFRLGNGIKREDDVLGADERKSISTFTHGNRYWLQSDMAAQIIACYRMDTDLTGFVTTIPTSRGAVEFMTDHYVGQDALFKCETDCLPKATAEEPQPGTITIGVHEMSADECITNTMIEDSAINVENWLATKIGGKFIRRINRAILDGNGNGMPGGLLRPNAHNTMLSGNVAGTPSGNFTWQDLVLMAIKLEPRFRANAVWWFGTNALAATMTMTDGEGRPIWTPQIINQSGMPTIMGKPVVEVTQMPDYLDGAGDKVVGSKPIALGDWKQAYVLLARRGFTAQRDPYTMARCGVVWHFSQRLGGDVLCRNASIFMQIK